MLTPQDFSNLLKLISSPRLSLTGAEVQTVAMLQWKLQNALKEADVASVAAQAQATADGDDSKPTE